MLATTRIATFKQALLALAGGALVVAFLFSDPVQGRGLLIAILGWLALFLVYSWGIAGIRPVAAFLLVLGGLEASLGIIQALGGIDYIGSYFRNIGPQATGTLINHNHFAGLMNMLIALAAGLAYAGYRRRGHRGSHSTERLGWAWLVVVLVAFMGLAVLLSLSRAGSVVLAATLVGIAAVAVIRSFSRGGRQAAALALAVLALTAVMTAAVGPGALVERFSRLGPDWELRSTLYEDTLAVVAESPWTGVGPGRFAWRLRPHQTLDAGIWWRYAHNDYLQSAAEWGLPLAGAFWLFVIWRAAACLRTFWVTTDPWLEGIALGTGGALLSILLHSLVDFNLQIPATLMVFGMLLGLSWVTSEAARCRPEEVRT